MSGMFETPENLRALMSAAVQADRTIALLRGGIADQLLRFAKEAVNKDKFLEACKREEVWIKSSDAGDLQVQNLSKCWSQAKSDIKGEWDRGLNPKEFPTYRKLKQAKVDVNKAKDNTGRASNDPRVENATTVEEALASGDVVDAKSTEITPDDLKQTVKYLGMLTELHRAKIVSQIERIAKDAHDMVGIEKRQAKGNRRQAA